MGTRIIERNNTMLKQIAIVLVLIMGINSVTNGQTKTTQRGTTEKSKTLDRFEKNPTADCSTKPDFQFKSLGYCIYYADAEAKLSRISVGKGDSAMRIEYDLPPHFSWGNWLSIRRDFDSLVDLSGFTGLKLSVKIEVLSKAHLRLTLSDVADSKKIDNDELWWFDFDASVLNDHSGKWKTLTLPFKKFTLSYGEGSRRNDGRLDISRIKAYEINFVLEGSAHVKGTIIVDYLRAYYVDPK
ncbi:MAG: CIA30 family protein [Ignavibacteriae bacterium]|nr:CIA30 family protein [Ignavibacteriota bacterium]